MSIQVQRQYLSPNCVLSLQGFSEEQKNDGQTSSVLTVLTSAQCQIL